MKGEVACRDYAMGASPSRKTRHLGFRAMLVIITCMLHQHHASPALAVLQVLDDNVKRGSRVFESNHVRTPASSCCHCMRTAAGVQGLL